MQYKNIILFVVNLHTEPHMKSKLGLFDEISKYFHSVKFVNVRGRLAGSITCHDEDQPHLCVANQSIRGQDGYVYAHSDFFFTPAFLATRMDLQIGWHAGWKQIKKVPNKWFNRSTKLMRDAHQMRANRLQPCADWYDMYYVPKEMLLVWRSHLQSAYKHTRHPEIACCTARQHIQSVKLRNVRGSAMSQLTLNDVKKSTLGHKVDLREQTVLDHLMWRFKTANASDSMPFGTTQFF